MFHCGGNSGVFLRIRDCNLVFLTTGKRGCHKPAPFVDEFGETDPGFRRGNPLYLNRELYRKYQRLWLHQGLAEEILNQYEVSEDLNVGVKFEFKKKMLKKGQQKFILEKTFRRLNKIYKCLKTLFTT